MLAKPLTKPLYNPLTRLSEGFTTLASLVKLLFANNEQGWWYDPSDLSTLYQDAAGTTPVTAMEQNVGLILDKSKGLVLGPELVTNPSVTGLPAGGGTRFYVMSSQMSSSLQAGKSYVIKYKITDYSGTGNVGIAGGSPAGMVQTNLTADGEYQAVQILTASGNFAFYTSNTNTCNFSNISVRELPGNHGFQSTLTKRMKVSRRVNLILNSEAEGGTGGTPGTAPTLWENQFASGTYSHTIENGKHRFSAVAGRITVRAPVEWSVNTAYRVTINLINNSPTSIDVGDAVYLGLQSATGVSATYYVDGVIGSIIPQGTHTVQIVASYSGGTPIRFLSFGAGASGVRTADVTLLNVDVRLAIKSHLPYQRVNTDTDYDDDPAKFPTYLKGDAIDDCYVTNDIDLTGTDKVLVAAGITKLSDAGRAIVVEAGNNQLNTFKLEAPNSAAPQLYFTSSGTLTGAANYSDSSVAAPTSNTVIGLGDISGNKAILLSNGVQVAISTANQGTGNYSKAPLNIGARNQTSLFFGGEIYSLIGRGALSNASQQATVNQYIKQRMMLP